MTHQQPRVIFVFGSNLLGHHLAGAAAAAESFWGARPGVGVGPAGESYALPTIGRDMRPLPLEDVDRHVRHFLAYAATNPSQTFYVTKVGCGIAGFTEREIAPLFRGAPVNVQLPLGWRASVSA